MHTQHDFTIQQAVYIYRPTLSIKQSVKQARVLGKEASLPHHSAIWKEV